MWGATAGAPPSPISPPPTPTTASLPCPRQADPRAGRRAGFKRPSTQAWRWNLQAGPRTGNTRPCLPAPPPAGTFRAVPTCMARGSAAAELDVPNAMSRDWAKARATARGERPVTAHSSSGSASRAKKARPASTVATHRPRAARVPAQQHNGTRGRRVTGLARNCRARCGQRRHPGLICLRVVAKRATLLPGGSAADHTGKQLAAREGPGWRVQGQAALQQPR